MSIYSACWGVSCEQNTVTLRMNAGMSPSCAASCSSERDNTHAVSYTDVNSITTTVSGNRAPVLPDYYVTTVVKGNYVPEVYIDEQNKIIYDVQKYSVTVTPNKSRIDAVVFNNINVQLNGGGTSVFNGTANGDCIQAPVVSVTLSGPIISNAPARSPHNDITVGGISAPNSNMTITV